MKRMKRLASLALTLVLALGLTVPAWAVNGGGTSDGKITVTNTVKDRSYSIYRIFDLESFSYEEGKPEEGAYSYKVNNAWSGFFTAPADGAEPTNGRKYVNIDEKGYVTWKDGASAADFAAAAIEYATADATKINAIKTETAAADNTSIEFTGLPLGYYLVKSDVGALCALTTTNKEATVIEKNAAPTLTKEVQEDSKTGNEAWGDKNDAEIGQTVNFRATITVEGVAKSYVMHDQMDDGLTFGSVTGVTLNGTTVAATDNSSGTEVVNYTVDSNPTDKHTFDVTFSDTFCAGLKSGDVIVVSYTATLNENAVDKVAENNKAYLSYQDSSDTEKETTPSETKTYTWNMPVFKYTMDGTNQTALAGAEFTLYTDENCTNAVELIADDRTWPTGQTKPEGDGYRVFKTGDTGVKKTVITTTTSGKFYIGGLDSGVYYLKETKAPTGYNQLDTVVKVTIGDTGAITVGNAGDEDYIPNATEVGVENKAGALLPSTGGMGTTVFYIAGGVLVAGAAVLLITKKRMKSGR